MQSKYTKEKKKDTVKKKAEISHLMLWSPGKGNMIQLEWGKSGKTKNTGIGKYVNKYE